jgi:ethanolamine utilization protein EutQ (cupin superfamily)
MSLDMEVAMEEYITEAEFQTLMEEILEKLKNHQITECTQLLEQVMKDAEENEKYIDHTYIGQVKSKKRLTKISEITTMLEKMTSEQIDNVHCYTVNEFDEPNHEAEALEAIVRLSKEHARMQNE